MDNNELETEISKHSHEGMSPAEFLLNLQQLLPIVQRVYELVSHTLATNVPDLTARPPT